MTLFFRDVKTSKFSIDQTPSTTEIASHWKVCVKDSDKKVLTSKLPYFLGLVIQEYGYRGLPNQGDAYAGFSRKTTKSRGY